MIQVKYLMHGLLIKQIYNYFLNLSGCRCVSDTAYITEHFVDDNRPLCYGCSLGHVRHTYACTLSFNVRWCTPSHRLLTVHHLVIATYVVFSLAFTQHNLCHYTRHMFIYIISYVSPHITVFILNNSLKSRSKRETRQHNNIGG